MSQGALLGSIQVGGEGMGRLEHWGCRQVARCASTWEGAAAETGPHWPACHTLDYCAKESLSDLPRCQPFPETGRVRLSSAEQDPRTMPQETVPGKWKPVAGFGETEAKDKPL